MIHADPEEPAQSWKTEGIAPMERPGAVARLFMAIVAFVERLNLKLSRLENPCVYDLAAFPWAAGVEREWRVIRSELDRVLLRKAELPNVQEITTDAAVLSRDAGWKIFPLVAYGLRSQPNIDLCPQTWRIVQAIRGSRPPCSRSWSRANAFPASRPLQRRAAPASRPDGPGAA